MTTVNKEEIQKFSAIAEEWWNVNGKFKPLHMFNPIRIEYILETTRDHFNIKDNSNEPLKNLRVLDIGCGGGLMSEPITRLGGKVTGIDASEKNIKVAKLHAEKNNLTINYLNKSPENLDDNEKYDVILNLEIVEHVEDLQLYLKSCSRLLKKNGIMFTATLNRTFTSFIKAILGAEYVLRWLPIGTHDWNKFVKPEELESLITNLNFQIKDVKGLEFKPISRKWVRSENLSVNYIMSSIKN
jgi:2-polyprenyl-6-hydroxyphenyl methylase/3-demethylubiquinone-9 3-methyltransferase|tara:strand:+ start:3546 stop:4271 length:726 start_codon:yes stop_codon:yes gene_type:complete